jgi:hypothetical protein
MRATRFSRRDRDAGLRRVSVITRWSAAGALAGTGLFAGLAAHVGRGAVATTATNPGAAARAGHRSRESEPAASDDGGNGFAQAGSPPAVLPSSGGSAPVVSGAS